MTFPIVCYLKRVKGGSKMCAKICEIVLAVILVVGGLLNLSPLAHKWLLVVVGVILFVHAFTCKTCCNLSHNEFAKAKSASRKR